MALVQILTYAAKVTFLCSFPLCKYHVIQGPKNLFLYSFSKIDTCLFYFHQYQYINNFINLPFFTAIQCKVPENPDNGRAVYASTSYNSLISYECTYGYMLIGDSVRRCERNKEWTGTKPSCKGESRHLYLNFFMHVSVVLRKHGNQ